MGRKTGPVGGSFVFGGLTAINVGIGEGEVLGRIAIEGGVGVARVVVGVKEGEITSVGDGANVVGVAEGVALCAI